MKIKQIMCSLTIGLFLVSPALAGYGYSTVKSYWTAMSPSGVSVFLFELNQKTGSPGCDTRNRFAVSTTTDFGRDIAEAVRRAKDKGSVFQAVGKNTCNTFSDSEDVDYIGVF